MGTSGYVYRHWRGGVFYPAGLRAREELAWYACNCSRTVELNNPFYRLPTKETFARWREQTPDGFSFAVKVSRYISHVQRLRDSAESLALFLEHAGQLGPKLGPLLVQLPRSSTSAPGRPRGVPRHPPSEPPLGARGEAPELAGTGRLRGARPSRRGALHARGRTGAARSHHHRAVHLYPHARGRRGRWPVGKEKLRLWAARIRGLTKWGKDAYVYFNNDWEGHAVRDAVVLREMVETTRRAAPGQARPPAPRSPPSRTSARSCDE